MNIETVPQAQTYTPIHPRTAIGRVHYTVADLERQIAFYTEVLGFKQLWRDGATAALGAGERELLRLTEIPGAPRPRRATGLYHTAFLLPTRWELAQLVRRVSQMRTPVQGHSNHGTHLALYLPDAEGNGIELAWDFPREVWPMKDGKMDFASMPRSGIDIPELMRELEHDPSPWNGLAAGTRIGHVHLHVADLDASRRFYHALLGLDVVLQSEEFGALFVSAGGYHHHIGMNIWNGRGAAPPPQGAQGLRYYSIELPDQVELERLVERLQAAPEPVKPEERSDLGGVLLRDPAHNGVLLTVEEK